MEKTRGERWHEQAMKEDPVKAFLIFSEAMCAIFAIVCALGG